MRHGAELREASACFLADIVILVLTVLSDAFRRQMGKLGVLKLLHRSWSVEKSENRMDVDGKTESKQENVEEAHDEETDDNEDDEEHGDDEEEEVDDQDDLEAADLRELLEGQTRTSTPQHTAQSSQTMEPPSKRARITIDRGLPRRDHPISDEPGVRDYSRSDGKRTRSIGQTSSLQDILDKTGKGGATEKEATASKPVLRAPRLSRHVREEDEVETRPDSTQYDVEQESKEQQPQQQRQQHGKKSNTQPLSRPQSAMVSMTSSKSSSRSIGSEKPTPHRCPTHAQYPFEKRMPTELIHPFEE